MEFVSEWQRQLGLNEEHLYVNHALSVLLLSEVFEEDDCRWALFVLVLREEVLRRTRFTFQQSQLLCERPVPMCLLERQERNWRRNYC